MYVPGRDRRCPICGFRAADRTKVCVREGETEREGDCVNTCHMALMYRE
jgi:hypothetical protein